MKRIPLILCLVIACAALAAEPPVEIGNAKAVRNRLVERALGYLGTRYVIGGDDGSGFDCSGLIYRVYLDTLMRQIPRTVKTLHGFSEQIRRSELEPGDLVFFDTVGPLTHVGIYIGESQVVHAASDGPKTGVIVSSLDEKYYANAYAGSGRILPSGGWIGILIDISGAPILGGSYLAGAGSVVTGGSLGGRISYNLFGMYPGLELKFEYDASLKAFTIPLQLTFGFSKNFWVSAGTTFAFTDAELTAGGSVRRFDIGGPAFLNTFGMGWKLFNFRVAGVKPGVVAGLSYTRLVPDESAAPAFFTDLAAGLKGYVGVNVGLDF
jgi:probable lipoprotein NlpC